MNVSRASNSSTFIQLQRDDLSLSYADGEREAKRINYSVRVRVSMEKMKQNIAFVDLTLFFTPITTQ